MVAGHLREKNGYYHMVLNYVDEYGKRHTPSKSTGLTVKGNKKRAEKMLSEARAAKEAELEARAIERSTGKAPAGKGVGGAGVAVLAVQQGGLPAEQMAHHPGIQHAAGQVSGDHIQDIPIHILSPFGSSTVKITAPPALSARTVPPCSSTIRLTMARPTPFPAEKWERSA